MSNFTYSDELYHYGILGMKWGVRRFQNEDGTRTEAGKQRYYKNVEKARGKLASAESEIAKAKNAKAAYKNAKDDPFAKKSGELKRLKKEAKYYNKKSTISKLDMEKRQAEWEIAKNQKKIDKLNGIANDTKVSAISPKAVYYGKKAAKAVAVTAVRAGVAALVAGVGAPVAAGAYNVANMYMNASALENLAWKGIGIDSVSEAAIEGGRQAIDAMLGITYRTPTERALGSAVSEFYYGKKKLF